MAADEFFSRVGREVFEPCLNSIGASHVNQPLPTVVRFGSADWFVELILLLEDGPRYSPRVEIGPLPELGSLPRQRQVDIMHTVPIGNELRRYNLQWRYRDATEMRTVYEQVREQIFKPFAMPFLADPERLRTLVSDRCAEIERAWRAEIAHHNTSVYRSRADQAFQQGDYAGYLLHIGQIPEEGWSATDRRKIDFARRKSQPAS
jgi:hypothetical protein